jgi:hypothetical protein
MYMRQPGSPAHYSSVAGDLRIAGLHQHGDEKPKIPASPVMMWCSTSIYPQRIAYAPSTSLGDSLSVGFQFDGDQHDDVYHQYVDQVAFFWA